MPQAQPPPPELDPAASLAPGAYSALARAWIAAQAALDPHLFGVVRRGVERALGHTSHAEEGAQDPVSEAALALAEQFVFYVPDVTHELRAPLRAKLGADGLRALIDALYVVDQLTRLRLAYARLFDPGELSPGETLETGEPAPLAAAIAEVHAEAMLLRGLDPLTTEIVRLRCADYHDCKT